MWASSQCLTGLTHITEAADVAVLGPGSAIIIAAHVLLLLLLLLAIEVIVAVALLLAAREAARAHPAEEEASLLIAVRVPDTDLLLLATTVDLDFLRLERSC